LISRNTEFDPLATTYNRCWGAEYHSQAFPVVEHLLLANLVPGANVLDICCGTGQFTKRVCDAGFTVVGIDASEKMLNHARQNLPETEFHLADVRSFSLNHQFDAAYSVFESLNHVPDLDGLQSAFRSIRQSLAPGASFLFDLNGEEAFSLYWNDTSAIVEDDLVCVLRSNYNEETRLATCQITLFENAPAWQRKDFQLRQTCHARAEVQDALLSAGFESVTLHNAEDAGMSEHLGFHRTFFLATVPE
jgi:SAM-dependent methyltransferase